MRGSPCTLRAAEGQLGASLSRGLLSGSMLAVTEGETWLHVPPAYSILAASGMGETAGGVNPCLPSKGRGEEDLQREHWEAHCLHLSPQHAAQFLDLGLRDSIMK